MTSEQIVPYQYINYTISMWIISLQVVEIPSETCSLDRP